MKLYARRGFEWAENGLVGLWSPVSTGGTQSLLLDCNPSTNNHGTLTGYANESQPWVGSESGTVLDFDGANDFVDFSSSVGNITRDITVACWFQTLQATSARLIAKPRLAGTQQAYSLAINVTAGRASWLINTSVTNATITSTTTVNTNASFFAVGTYDGRNTRLFINGVQQTASAITGDLLYSNVLPFQIGRFDAAGSYFSGRIAEALVFQRAISSSEITQAYQVGPGGLWQDRPRRSRVYFGAAGFKAYWAKRQSQLIGGGV